MADQPQHTLLVVRHAKSDWGAALPDRDRPLNKRGRRDAPEVGRWLAGQRLEPDWSGVSPAVRTQQTWQLIAEAAGVTVPVETVDGLYLAGLSELVEAVRAVPEPAGTAALVIHSPGCGQLVQWLTAGAGNDAAQAEIQAKFPTGAVAWVELAVPWREAAPGSGWLADFAVPRG